MNKNPFFSFQQILAYADIVFTTVFTIEIVLKVITFIYEVKLFLAFVCLFVSLFAGYLSSMYTVDCVSRGCWSWHEEEVI